MRTRLCWLILFVLGFRALAQEVLPGTKPLTLQGDLSAQMVAGIDRFFTRETEQAVAQRPQYWQRDFSSVEAYDKSVRTNRDHLRKMIGAVDARLPVKALEFVGTTASPARVCETGSFTDTLDGLFSLISRVIVTRTRRAGSNNPSPFQGEDGP